MNDLPYPTPSVGSFLLLSIGKFGPIFDPSPKNADVLNGWSLKVTKIRRAYAREDDHQVHNDLIALAKLSLTCRMNRKIIFNSLIINITRSKITEIKRLFHPFYSLH